MNAFEQKIGKTFVQLRDAKIADIRFLYPPMRIGGMKGKYPCYIQSGKAPYDAGGYYFGTGQVIGVELKESARKHSLPIVGPTKGGDGLQWHQLEALVSVHEAGGMALVLWDNGGEIGYATGETLRLAKLQYETSMKVEAQRKTPARGSRSIPWGLFGIVKYGNGNVPLWLPKSTQSRQAW